MWFSGMVDNSQDVDTSIRKNDNKHKAYGSQMVLECDLETLECDYKCSSGSFAGYERDFFNNKKQQFNNLIHQPDRPLRISKLEKLENRFEQDQLNSLNFKLNYRIKDVYGDIVPVQENGLIMRDKDTDGVILHSVVSVSQKTKQFNVNSSLTHNSIEFEGLKKATHDGMAYQRSREFFLKMADQLSKQKGCNPIFMVVGIDQLRLVNAAHGFQATDLLLKQYEKNLETRLRDIGHFLRISGDKFGILMPNEDHYPKIAQDLLQAAQSYPLKVNGKNVWLSLSIGVYKSYSPHKADLLFIEKAEAALKVARRRGRGSLVEYNKDNVSFDEKNSQKLLDIGEMFLEALHSNRIAMAYQPVIDTSTKSVLFYETLLRLIDTENNVIDAHYIAPALHELGMIRIADFFAINHALNELMTHPELNLSVNVAQTTLTDEGWQEFLLAKIKQSPSIGERLIIELIETGHKEDIDHLKRTMARLKAYGVRFAIDDFGAGHTNFSEFMNLEIDFIKIDKQFVSHGDAEKSVLFIEALHHLAQKIGVTTIGEGVETDEHLDVFGQRGVKTVQGFLYGRPSLEKLWVS